MTFVTQILILLFVPCVWNVEGNVLVKRRLNTLETRVNSIEMRIDKDIEALNTSIIIRDEQACVCSNVRDENDGRMKQNLGQSVVVPHQSEALMKRGFVDEKKWVRKKVEIFENEIRKAVNQVENNNDAIAETVTRMQVKENDLDRKLNEAISEVMTNCSNKIVNQVENNNDMIAEIVTRMQVKENDLDRKLREAISEVMKNCSDEIVNREKNNNDLIAETVTRMQVKENDLDRKLNEAISEVMANCSAEIRKKDEKMDEQQVEIDNRKQMINKMIERLPCPDGWTKFQAFCYLYVKEKQTYVSARETCLKLGASVADIQSSSENDFVYKLCENNGHTWTSTLNEGRVWIGLTDEETEGIWISDRTREKNTYMNWRPGQPDDVSQDCLIMGYKAPYDQWNDWRCEDTEWQAQFVCKKEL